MYLDDLALISASMSFVDFDLLTSNSKHSMHKSAMYFIHRL